jgi:quercetin 2,3-dioxygenase
VSGPVASEDVGPTGAVTNPTGESTSSTGPATGADPTTATTPSTRPQPAPAIVTPSREAKVGGLRVRRALPRRERRTVGAWCFVDHMGPAPVSNTETFDVAPHPHMGLQTVTWLLAGEVVHRDSLGSEQVIRPGQLNLMTAGHGVSHSEEHTGAYRGDLHGVQLWVAQPEFSRHGPPEFEHHAELPRVDLGPGSVATVLVGELEATLRRLVTTAITWAPTSTCDPAAPWCHCGWTSSTPWWC